MHLPAGTRLGPYEVLAPLGSGGMGEVYRARDTKLDRDVALKVMSDRLAADAQAMARFEREAKAVAALSHPGILAIHDFGRATVDGQDIAFAVTELLEGETLRAALATGPLPVRRAVDVAAQLAEALASAHEKGIVHRDLKPDNVVLTGDGRAKVLDFGLARQFLPEGTSGDESPTATLGTEPGMVVGTAAYMSPEQAKGRPADARTDIFALGAVLHEMLSGRRPFDRETLTETLAAILRDDPPDLDPARIPPALERIVRRCLEKRPDARFQSGRDLAFALSGLSDPRTSAVVRASVARRGRPRAVWALLALTTAAAFGLGRWTFRPATHGGSPTTARLLTESPGEERWPRLTPDGQTVVYAGNARGNFDIYALRVGGANPQNLTPDSPADDLHPAVSPDGQRIAFRSEREGGGIFLMGLTGESPRRLTDFGYLPSWSPDGGSIVVSTRSFGEAANRPDYASELWVVDVATGEKRLLAKADAIEPAWSPRGDRVAFWSKSPREAQRDLFTVPAGGGDPVALTDDAAVDWNPVWSADGRQLYFLSDRGGTQNLWRLLVDERSGRARGEPEPLMLPSAVVSDLGLSPDGRRLVYSIREIRGAFERLEIDAAGRGRLLDPLMRTNARTFGASFSPDGESVVVSLSGARPDLHVVRWDGSGSRRLTEDPWWDRFPDWSPDGRWIAFHANRNPTGVYRIHPDGSGLEPVTRENEATMYPVWAPDGTRLVASRKQGTQPAVFPAEGEGRDPVDLPPTPGGQRFINLSWSPDGKRLVGELFAEGPFVTTIYSFETRSWKTFDRLVGSPEWMPDGVHLLVSSDRGLAQVNPDTGEERAVLSRPLRSLYSRDAFAVSRDGRRVVFWEGSNESDVWLADPR